MDLEVIITVVDANRLRSRYDLSLLPNFDPSFAVDGNVRIELDCLSDGSNITLHSVNHTIEAVTLLDGNNDEIDIIGIGIDEERQFIIIFVEVDKLVKGQKLTMELKFKVKKSVCSLPKSTIF